MATVSEILTNHKIDLDLNDSDEDETDNWKYELQNYRVDIVDHVIYDKIGDELVGSGVFDTEDHEEVKNKVVNKTNRQMAACMLDKIMKKGRQNFEKFTEILGRKYPELYEKITKRPPPVIELTQPIMPTGEVLSEAAQHVMKRLLIENDNLKTEINMLRDTNKTRNKELEERTREWSNFKERVQELRLKNERYQSSEQDLTALKGVVDKLRTEHCTVCMRLLKSNEDNSKLREENKQFRNDIDRKTIELKRLETAVKSEHSTSIRLKRRLDNGPSNRDINSKQNEIDQLRLMLAQAKKSTIDENNDMKFQILQQDKEEAIEMCEEVTRNLNMLRDQYSSIESMRDQYQEENESLQSKLVDLQEECDMYKDRRDGVWQQLQEVEKERDQLMRERNDAQIIAQSHMEEKTKYRGHIRQLEAKQDDLISKLKQKRNKISLMLRKERHKHHNLGSRTLDSRFHSINDDSFTSGMGSESSESFEPIAPVPRDRHITDDWSCRKFRVYITKFYPEYNTKSEFNESATPDLLPKDGIFPEVPLSSDYPTHKQPKRKDGIRKTRISSSQALRRSVSEMEPLNGSPSRQTRSMSYSPVDSQSMTSSNNSGKQFAKRDGKMYDIIIDGKLLRDNVSLIGGNQSGIFLHQLQENDEIAQCGLIPGMLITKIQCEGTSEMTVKNWTLEYAHTTFQSLEGEVILTVQYKQQEFASLKEAINNTRSSGDSFYIRSNYNCKHEDFQFEKGDILRVVNTKPEKRGFWRAIKVHSNNGADASKKGFIPNVKSSEIFTAPRTSIQKRKQSEPALPELPGLIFMTTKFYDPSPYTTLHPILTKEKYRPCLILPNSLAKTLNFKLSTKAEPFAFYFPQPGIINCNEKEAEQIIKDGDGVSYKSISRKVQEVVTVENLETLKIKKQHSILHINENLISIEDYLNKLHKRRIYPVVVSLVAEKRKSVQMLLDGDKDRVQFALQSIASTSAVMKKALPDHVQLNLDKCNRVEDAVKQIIEKFAVELNKVIWLPYKDDIYM